MFISEFFNNCARKCYNLSVLSAGFCIAVEGIGNITCTLKFFSTTFDPVFSAATAVHGMGSALKPL